MFPQTFSTQSMFFSIILLNFQLIFLIYDSFL